jgi:hypothetical protein
MNLYEAVAKIAHMGDPMAVYTRPPWRSDAPAVIAPLTEDARVPPELLQAGFACFLEASVVSEILDDRSRSILSEDQLVKLLLHYGEYDGFPRWANELLAF